MELYDWQKPLAEKALASLKAHRFFVNACCTGSGKTPVALQCLKDLGCPGFVIAPKAARTQWLRSAEAMGVQGQIVGVTNPSQVSKPSGCEFYDKDKLWKLPPSTLVVWDEIHRGCSGPKSIATQAAAQLKAYPGFRLLAMSATPACSPLQLRSLAYWGGLHGFNRPSYYAWCRAHGCADREIGWGRDSAGRKIFEFTRSKKLGQEIMAKIRKDFGDQFLSLAPEEIPGFPEQQLDTLLVDLNARDRKEIDEAIASMSPRLRETAKAEMPERGRELARIEFTMAAALAELAAASVEDGNSAVVFFNWTEARERFESELEKLGVTDISRVYGVSGKGRAQTEDERTKDVDLFQSNVNRVISVMVQAGGAALSLHDERHERMRESFIVPGDDAAAVKQALGRIRRCNGTFAEQHFVFAAGTKQERVATNMQRKFANISALCDSDLII